MRIFCRQCGYPIDPYCTRALPFAEGFCSASCEAIFEETKRLEMEHPYGQNRH